MSVKKKMTWGQFKQRAAENGLTDDTEILEASIYFQLANAPKGKVGSIRLAMSLTGEEPELEQKWI